MIIIIFGSKVSIYFNIVTLVSEFSSKSNSLVIWKRVSWISLERTRGVSSPTLCFCLCSSSRHIWRQTDTIACMPIINRCWDTNCVHFLLNNFHSLFVKLICRVWILYIYFLAFFMDILAPLTHHKHYILISVYFPPSSLKKETVNG